MTDVLFAEAKVGEDNVSLCIQQYVLWFQVPVDYVQVVEVAQSRRDLCRIKPATNQKIFIRSIST